MNREEVIKLIEIAFKGVELEDGISLHQADIIDEYGSKEEIEKARQKDIDSGWGEVPTDLIEQLQVLPHLDAKGFRYYIPAYMLWTLQNFDTSDSFSSDATIYALAPSGKDKLWDLHMTHYSLLNKEQRNAIKKFLLFCSDEELWGVLDTVVAKQGLDKYWSTVA